jgi:hypothetical protein
MAGVGSSWGTREEMLHPRDRRGRFRKKWKMAENVVAAITGFLDRFTPRTFQSDGQAAQYLFNRAKPIRFGGGQGYGRLHADWDEANEHLRSGDIDEPTRKFVKMMDDSAVELDSDVILQRTMGPDAFGLTPEQMNAEDGGVEDFTGRLIADRGYTAANIGSPLGHGPGKITMTIAVPKGTKAMIPARSQNDRGIFLDRDQELRITKVRSDGQGGWYMMAVATPRTPGDTPEPIDRSPRGAGLTPQQREERVKGLQGMQAKRQGIRSDAEINAEEIQRGTEQGLRDQPAELPPAQGPPSQPAAPGEPPPRNEPVLKESVGGADTQGKGTAEIAQTPPPEPEAPAVPAAPAPDIRRAVREAGIPSPSEGNRRREWNNAYLGVASGKKNPEDMLRELEADIKFNRGLQEDKNAKTGAEDATLADDIKAQDQLADAIAKEYGLQRTQEPGAPVKRARGPARLPEESRQRLVQQRKELREQALPPGVEERAKREAADTEVREKARQTNIRREAEAEAADAADKEIIDRWLSEAGVQDSELTDMDRLGLRVVASSLGRGRISRTEAARRLRTDREGSRLNEIADKIEALPVKKAAKKAAPAAPEAVPAGPSMEGRVRPGGQIPLGKIAKGDRVYVEQRDGKWHPTTRKTGSTIITVDERVPVSATRRRVSGRSTSRSTIVGHDDQGNVIRVDGNESGYPGIQTFKAATPTPAKKTAAPAAKKAAPVKAAPVAKKAAPAVPEPGAVPDLDKMTVPELRKLAKDELVPLGGLTRKAQIKEAILRNRESGSGGVSTAGAEAVLGPGVLQRIQRDNAPDSKLLADLADGLGIKGDAGGLIPARQLDLNQGMSELEVADRIFQDADRLEASPMPAPGTDKTITKAMQDRRDESVANLRKLAAQLRAHGSPPAEPKAPAAQKTIETPDRREAFAEDWLNTRAMAKINDQTAAGRSILEVRDDVAAGRITPDEGIRRLETDIELNKADLAEAEQELRGDLPADERETVSADVDKLRKAIGDQENASSFLRKHFRRAPAVTPDEIKVQLSPEIREAIDKATPDEIRADAKRSGIELKGDTKDELMKDLVNKIGRKVAAQELQRQATKKAAPKKLAPAPLEPKKATTPGHVDARLLAEGLEMDESDSKMLAHVQDMLDGTGGERVHTPAAAGRRLKELNNGAGSPSWERVVHGQITLEKARDRVAGREPSLAGPDADRKALAEAEAKDASLKAQSDRWNALAERLQKTRRPSAKKAAPPAPSTKLTPDEKKTTKAAAELLDVPAEKLQAQVVAKRAAAAPPSQGAQNAVDAMKTMQTREEGQAFLKNRTKTELQEIAKAGGVTSFGSKATKQQIADQIVQWTIGRRLDTDAITRNITPSVSKPEPGLPQDNPRILARLNDKDANDVPVLNREQAADLIAPLKKARLVEIAKTYNIPNASSKTMADLRREIVDASVGLRRDSVAVRGFTGARPSEGGPGRPLESLRPSELAELEDQLGIKRTSLDRMERVKAIRAKQVGIAQGPSTTRSLPASGRKWNWDVIDQDNMTMHGDSASMNLAQKLRKAGREEDAQYVADMRWRISNDRGDHSPDDVEKMVKDLKAMMAAEQDPALKAAYARALDDIEAPESPAPELPASTPPALRKMMDELNQIPAARRTGHFAGTTKKVSAVNRLAELIRKVETGEAGSVGTVESEIRSILRSFHESVDGAFQMWRLEKLMEDRGVGTWVRSFYPKT